MATPDYSHIPTEVEWSLIPDYTPIDNEGTHTCAMTGFKKRPGEVVYRGQQVDEWFGHFTIGQDSAEQLARLIGWIDPDTLVMTPDEMLEAEVLELRGRVAELESQLAAVREMAR